MHGKRVWVNGTIDFNQNLDQILFKLKIEYQFFNESMAQPHTQKWMNPFSKSFSNITNEYACH